MAREIRQRIISCVDPQASGESSRAGKQQVGAWCLLYMRAWSVSQGQEPFHCYGAAVRCSFQKKRKKITAFFQNLLLYACRARAGAGTQDEGSVQPRFALVMLVTMHLREPASW